MDQSVNQLVIVVIFILMPGIIAAIICDKITSHTRWDSFKFTLYALMLGMASYAALQMIVYAFNVIMAVQVKEVSWTNLKIWNSSLNGGQELAAWEICAAIGLSIPVAVFAAWLVNYKIFNKLAQKINVSTKFGDENLYSYYLNAQEIDWVYIRDIENNYTYQGRVVSHAENDKVQELVLSDVSVFRLEDSELLYEVPTIYLSKEMGKFIIEAIPHQRLG